MREIFEDLYSANVELVESSGGVFEIFFGEKLVFSKKKHGRFPSEQELMELKGK